jgi:site-specific recombinase XerD
MENYKSKFNTDCELLVTPETHIQEAFSYIQEYRQWSKSTLQCYQKDIEAYERYLYSVNKIATLGSATLSVVQRWLKHQKDEEKIASSTIRRRLAALSTVYEFYKSLGFIEANPFKAVSLPTGEKGYYSVVLNMDQLKHIWSYLDDQKKAGLNIELTVKVMLFTGLRNEALCRLQVKDIIWEKQLLRYDAGIQNSKHKIQFFPIPPRLFSMIKEHIQQHDLSTEDSLLFGLKGFPLRNKQLNRITNKISDELGWGREAKVTPHGFRATIATLLDEQGVSLDAIQYLLGHSQKENVHVYLRRDQRKINQLRLELCKIEDELENSLYDKRYVETKPATQKDSVDHNEQKQFHFEEELILQLLDLNPTIALAIIQKELKSKRAQS